ncbi:MAG TPA: hypothetical protein VGA40_10285, partial [Candidatus Acidoferrales bacterium]
MKRVLKAWVGVMVMALALGAASSVAQEKRAMTFMDIMEMRGVGGGGISPDGKWVLYTVSIPNWKAGRNFADIFLAPTDGSAPPRQMTFTREQSESNVEWARDSRSFAFASTREGNSRQIYLMRIDGGEARKLTEQRDGVNNFSFSRDGKWLAYSGGRADQRQLYLIDLSTDELKPAQLTRRQTPVNAWSWTDDSARIFFLSPERVDRTERERRQKRFDVRITDPPRIPQHLWSVTVADKSEKRWTSGGDFTVAGFNLAPDVAHALVRSGSLNRHSSGALENESELYLLNLASGDLRRLTENKMGEGGAAFSPDSKWISFTAADDFTWGRNSKLYLMPVAGGPLRKMLPDWDHSVGGINWSRDSKTIYFSEGLGVNNHVFALDVASGKLTQLTNETG